MVVSINTISCGFLLFLVVVATMVASVVVTATATGGSNNNNNVANHMNSYNNNWVDECKLLGYDPIRLGCNTCTVLPEPIQNECLQCCQTYIDVERITKPFQSAVLVQMTNTEPTEGELGNFFKDDWNVIVDTKGTNKLMKLVDPTASKLSHRGGNSINDFMFYFGTSRQTAEILFFDEPLPPINTISYTNLSSKAKETVQLDGMKREDIKDMIMTLL